MTKILQKKLLKKDVCPASTDTSQSSFVYDVSMLNTGRGKYNFQPCKAYSFHIFSPNELNPCSFALYSHMYDETFVTIKFLYRRDTKYLPDENVLNFLKLYHLIIGMDVIVHSPGTVQWNHILFTPIENTKINFKEFFDDNTEEIIDVTDSKQPVCKTTEDLSSLFINRVIVNNNKIYYVIEAVLHQKNELQNEILLRCWPACQHLNFLVPDSRVIESVTFPLDKCSLVFINRDLHHALSCLVPILQRLRALTFTSKIPLAGSIVVNTNDNSFNYHWLHDVMKHLQESTASDNICVVLQQEESAIQENSKRKLQSVEIEGISVSSHQLLQAMTPPENKDGFSYDTLQIFGQVYLRYLIIQSMFVKYPSWSGEELLNKRYANSTFSQAV